MGSVVSNIEKHIALDQLSFDVKVLFNKDECLLQIYGNMTIPAMSGKQSHD